jgi:hypothetical protein
VNVQVKDALSRTSSAIRNKTVAILGDAQLPRHFSRREDKTATQPTRRVQVRHALHVPSRDDQNMHGGLWGHVMEGKPVVSLRDHIRRDLTIRDPAEQAVFSL